MTEIELQQLLEELIAEGECEFIEFKKNHYKDFAELGKYFSALANGACLRNKDFGFLIFGIEDKTYYPEGTKRKFEDNGKTLELHFRTFVKPKTKFEIHHFHYKEKLITLLKFAAAKGEPVTYDKIPWGRVKSHLVDLRSDLHSDLLKIIYNSDLDWSAQIAEKATIEDLDEEAIKKAKRNFCERRENAKYLDKIDSWDVKTFLNKAEILINGKITNAALILLGKREARHHLKNLNVAEITWGLETLEEKAYEHFYPPFILCTSEIWSRIRNTKYKLFPANELLSREVDKYDKKVVLEALYNCIAHQNYFLNSRIILTEKADRLIFISAGNFFEGKAEDYATGEKIAQKYRNQFLANAMVNLAMIDKRGYGINQMYLGQKKRFFPLPDYSKSNSENVILEIYGRVIDEKFSQILMEKDLDFPTTILLDRVQKNLPISEKDIKILRQKKLIEGRKPNYFIAAEIASATNQKEKYIKNRAFSKEQYKAWILKFLDEFKEISRKEVDDILMNHLSNILSNEAKKKKIDNLLQEMSKKDKTIKNYGNFRSPKWRKLGEN